MQTLVEQIRNRWHQSASCHHSDHGALRRCKSFRWGHSFRLPTIVSISSTSTFKSSKLTTSASRLSPSTTATENVLAVPNSEKQNSNTRSFRTRPRLTCFKGFLSSMIGRGDGQSRLKRSSDWTTNRIYTKIHWINLLVVTKRLRGTELGLMDDLPIDFIFFYYILGCVPHTWH